MRKPALLITDFSIAEPREKTIESDSSTFSPISKKKPGVWRLIDYETDLFSGRFLQSSDPNASALTIPLNLEGWHSICVGIAGTGVKTTETVIELRLTGESHWQIVRSNEWDCLVEEPWKFADLTGKSLEIRFPAVPKNSIMMLKRRGETPVARLFSVRVIPLSDEHVALVQKKQSRPVMFFNDGHGIFHEAEDGAEAIYKGFLPFAESEWKLCCFGAGGADIVNYGTKIGTVAGEGAWDAEPGQLNTHRVVSEMIERGQDPLRLAIELAHEQKQSIIVYIRNQQWVCEPPLDHLIRSKFYSAHPEYCCIEADGTVLGSKLSIGFEEVRRQMNGILSECLDRGADGVALCFVRGFPLVRYEQPVLDLYRKVIGGDARKIQPEDARIRRIWIEISTVWIQEIRHLLDRYKPCKGQNRRWLVIIGGPNIEWNLQFGIDVEVWARKKLIDIVVPYPRGMEIKGDNLSPGILGYSKVLKGSGVQILPSLGSYADHELSLFRMRKRAHSFYESGATGLSRWDTDGWLSHLDWDEPSLQKLWVEEYMPPTANRIRSLAGLERIIFSPRIGV